MSGKHPALRKGLEDLSDMLQFFCKFGRLPTRKLGLENLTESEIQIGRGTKFLRLLTYADQTVPSHQARS